MKPRNTFGILLLIGTALAAGVFLARQFPRRVPAPGTPMPPAAGSAIRNESARAPVPATSDRDAALRRLEQLPRGAAQPEAYRALPPELAAAAPETAAAWIEQNTRGSERDGLAAALAPAWAQHS